MDNDTYEQVEIPASRVEWEKNFLKESMEVIIQVFQETEILGIILPDKVDLEVTYTEPAVKGDTQTAALKNATVETGLTIKVPLFIEQNEMITLSTIDGKYAGRANPKQR